VSQRAEDERSYQKAIEPVTALLRAWLMAPAETELEALNALNSKIMSYSRRVQHKLAVRVCFTQSWLDERMRLMIVRHYERLVSRLTNAEAVRELHEFIKRSRQARRHPEDARGGFGHYDVGLQYPVGWLAIVSQFVYDPPLELYGDFSSKEVDRNLRQRAADALELQDLAAAKLILAICDSFEGHRGAVGEILYADLAKLVSELQPELGRQQR